MKGGGGGGAGSFVPTSDCRFNCHGKIYVSEGKLIVTNLLLAPLVLGGAPKAPQGGGGGGGGGGNCPPPPPPAPPGHHATDGYLLLHAVPVLITSKVHAGWLVLTPGLPKGVCKKKN